MANLLRRLPNKPNDPPVLFGRPIEKKEARNGRPLSIMAAGKNTHMDKDLLAKVLYGAKAVAVIIGPA